MADVTVDPAAEAARTRPNRMYVRVYRSRAEHDRDDQAYWRSIPVAERVLEVWRLSEELWRLRGEFADEPGLHRSVARIRRR